MGPDDWTVPDEPTDERTLRAALEDVVAAASENGVAVERDFVCRAPDGDRQWVVDVARLADESDTDP
jgi:hypothetical protein